jgi:osmotically-inducible protein OsmY
MAQPSLLLAKAGPPGATRPDLRRGDASIQSEILRSIGQAPWLDAKDVSIAVQYGEVEVTGRVEQDGTRLALLELIGRCRGVRAVVDRLRIAAAPGKPL